MRGGVGGGGSDGGRGGWVCVKLIGSQCVYCQLHCWNFIERWQGRFCPTVDAHNSLSHNLQASADKCIGVPDKLPSI